MTLDILMYAFLGVTIIFAVWLTILEYRLMRVFKGKTGADMESLVTHLQTQIAEMEASQKKMLDVIKNMDARVKHSVQTVNTVRFNPFENEGSNQSFVTAFLDEYGDGVVISTLYSRERVNVYAKPISGGKSEYNLSDEEKHAIAGE